MAFALYGITAIMAPTIGPTLGGWITFNYWRWIFLINIPVGLAAFFLVRLFVEDPPYLARLRGAGITLDYIGIALLTFGIGALQILLDKGPGRRLVWLAIHHHAGGDRVRVSGRPGYLGMVPREPHH